MAKSYTGLPSAAAWGWRHSPPRADQAPNMIWALVEKEHNSGLQLVGSHLQQTLEQIHRAVPATTRKCPSSCKW